ncbi:hypothetical protein BGZ76_011631 [Entomortierella beljakovae]|nr:hypothetical protein BGZ76_011631 [Entomortierella beljakovae]
MSSISISQQPKSSDSTQAFQYTSQHSQYPYNPYPHQSRNPYSQSQGPLYTLRDQTSNPTPTLESFPPRKHNSNDPLSPPQDMLVALEKILMGISPFPPSIPTLAKPTCPPIEDQSMAELSSPSLSPTSSSTSEPTEPSSMDQFYLKQEQPSEKQPMMERFREISQRQGESHSFTRSISPSHSPYSYGSSSPMLATEASRELPYWSPPTPSLHMEHSWSNRSSPMLPSHQQPSSHSSAWNYSLFDQMSLPINISEADSYVASSDNQDNNQSQQRQQQQYQPSQSYGYSSSSPNPSIPYNPNPFEIKRRAARTPPRQKIVSELSGVRSYVSSAHYSYHHRQYSQHSGNQSAASGSTSSNNGGNGSASSSNSNNNNTNTGTRGAAKSYPCTTCNRAFPTRTQLKSHMAIHTDNFPFPCLYSGCDLHFKRKHDLRRHVDAKHALVKKYLCASGCGEGFGRRDQMVRHLRKGVCKSSFQSI